MTVTATSPERWPSGDARRLMMRGGIGDPVRRGRGRHVGQKSSVVFLFPAKYLGGRHI